MKGLLRFQKGDGGNGGFGETAANVAKAPVVSLCCIL